ncbi:L,D-transpeptidase [Microvirga sp. W0021]|uniref:L,D-transpeptidase n=1 Tax=Hohaiivirga grylli TaxID=3133970 RepID=A0ABV0BP80_9HYPH
MCEFKETEVTVATCKTSSIKTVFQRLVVAVGLPLLAAACASPSQQTDPNMVNADMAHLYAAVHDNGVDVPAINVAEIKRRNLRQMVDYETREPTGTIIVDPRARFLYLVMGEGKAMRYGIGVAKAGLAFEGRAYVGRKATWPSWTPTAAMIKREPKRYGPYAGGLKGGIANPLGARALYLYKGGSDTLYRIHGTNEPWSIGERVSSGCIRLFNQDILDLFSRVPTGTRVVVLGAGPDEPDDAEGHYVDGGISETEAQ